MEEEVFGLRREPDLVKWLPIPDSKSILSAQSTVAHYAIPFQHLPLFINNSTPTFTQATLGEAASGVRPLMKASQIDPPGDEAGCSARC